MLVIIFIEGKINMIKTLIFREEMRNENMIKEYTKELMQLPKGKITSKNINGKVYYYLYYRDGGKVISKYIGKNEDTLKELQEKLTRRYQVEEILKKLKEEKIQIKKMEAML